MHGNGSRQAAKPHFSSRNYEDIYRQFKTELEGLCKTDPSFNDFLVEVITEGRQYAAHDFVEGGHYPMV